MKRITFFLIATMMTMSVMGQMTSDTIGTGATTVTNSVLPGFYGYHLSATLYTATEMSIPSGASIQSLSYHITYGNSFNWYGQRVRISLFESNSDSIDLSQSWNSITAQATLVYDSTSFDLQWDDYWKEFLFSQPFTYNGGNLIVLVEGYGCDLHSGDCETEMYVNNGTRANCWIRVNDGTPFNFNATMSSIPSGTHGNYINRPNIYFTYSTNTPPPTPSCTVTLPYTQDFENLTAWQDYPVCWGQLDYYGGLPYTLPGISPIGYQNSDGCLFFAIQSGGSVYGVTPCIDTAVSLQNVTLSFYYKSRETSTIAIVVGVMTHPQDSSTFVAVDTIHANAPQTWEFKEVNLAPYTGNGHYIAFRMDSQTSSYSFPSAFIDNVTIEISASCTPPTQINATVTDGGTGYPEATISWFNTPNTSDVRLFYKASSDSIYNYVDIAGQNSYVLTGLSYGTRYDYRLMSLCGSDTSSLSQPASFSTPCESISTFPWSEDFENGLICWTLDASVPSQQWDNVSNGTYPTVAPHSGNSMARFYAYSFLMDDWSTMASPAIDMSQDLLLSFYFHRYGSMSSYTGAPYADRMEIYVSSTPEIDSTSTLLSTQQGYAANSGWEQVQLVIPAQTQPYNYIILKGISDYGYNLYIDDITLDYHTPSVEPEDTVVFIEAGICEGESFDFNGTLLTTAGMYVDTLSRTNGADSIVNLTLTVYPTYDISLVDTILLGETYDSYGFLETTSGHYQQTLTTIFGCDSIIQLHLTVLDTTSGLSDHRSDLALHLYPNPAQEQFVIDGVSSNESYVVEIIDSRGILSRRMAVTATGHSLVIRREGLANGLYLVTVHSRHGSRNAKILLQ